VSDTENPTVTKWRPRSWHWILAGVATAAIVVSVSVVLLPDGSDKAAPPADPTTPTGVAQAWIEAFQSGDLDATRELSCAELRPELDPDTYNWTRLVEGEWTPQPETINGAEAEVEMVRFADGDATLFHLTRTGDTWQVCDPFDVQPNW
jgi:hypothetical protein